MRTSGKIKFWWGCSFVSYEPTPNDQAGCDGVYVENTHFKSKIHMLLYYLICGLKEKYIRTK